MSDGIDYGLLRAQRIVHLIRAAIDAMKATRPAEYLQRVIWCKENEHWDVSSWPTPDGGRRIAWGGADLVIIAAELLEPESLITGDIHGAIVAGGDL